MATLFTDIKDLKSIIPQVHTSMADAEIFPYIEDAADKYMIPFISQEYYDELVTQYNGILTEANEDVITYIRKAAGWYGIYEASPHINMQVASSGMKGNQNDNTAQLRQWEFNLARKSAIQKADLYLDKALAKMEAAPDSYATWKATSAYTVHRQFFITNAADFSTHVNIGESRRTYMKLRPYLQLAESRHIKVAIGETLMDALKTRIKAGTNTADDDALMEYIYPAAAYYTMYMAAPNLKLDISQDGIRMVSTNDGITNIVASGVSTPEYHAWRKEIYGHAEYHLANLKKFLDDNTDTYTEYADDDAADNNTPNYSIPDNTGSSSSVII
jgi:sulfur relay (sulfurtransferase) DsrC/TusE family protein